MATCYPLIKGCKRSEERKDWAFNWTHELARKWQPDIPYAAGVTVRPSQQGEQTGLQYSSSGGQSAAEEPDWPTTVGASVTDGRITWTAEALSLTSLEDQVSASDWEADSALTVDGDSQTVTPGLQLTFAYVEGGVSGQTYEVVNTMTTLLGRIFQGVVKLRIDG
jgi:hypothetical protein